MQILHSQYFIRVYLSLVLPHFTKQLIGKMLVPGFGLSAKPYMPKIKGNKFKKRIGTVEMLISKNVLAAMLTITGLLTSQIVQAAEAQITQKIGSAETPAHTQKTQASADNANTVTVNAITGAAAKAGVAKCLARVNQVTSFVTANSESAAYLFISHT